MADSRTEGRKMSHRATTIAIVNQKGGTGKTTSTENIGVALAMEGKKVLCFDAYPGVFDDEVLGQIKTIKNNQVELLISR